ncbi:hypothetical protein BV98_000868 [Sphingobium herbicidovorans NBRC 16415]|uniref:3-keto-alpha-glucoside-1,2-lyase/3-keto-2-hydroxy-glucal hydratase domain-containing protein n=1 Tax=Sphingobium herbicidovorans (strain ATCC 700291 / DSM 11019 / CCUG 56400 / KCTC 2939 / LMG 18315 / NBRC 16415 / MH) TaxID=1219045 RepID=A0A086PDA7_SPHHM|nr:DUF1080 domain-containing protein [Sphingobium herbicidovorans]KFG91375.1 hypothetical protein BV98_000868 [Sphingobium herbicidovorans NBRC 16415]
MDHETRRTFIAGVGALAVFPRLAAAAQPREGHARHAIPPMPQRVDGDGPGFKPLFDGRTLSGWRGDPQYWRVEDGAIVGQVTPDTLLRSNTFLIWSGGKPEDFELKLDYRITLGGNSGINYRSVVVKDEITPANRFALSGLQFDIDGRNLFTAMVYEERGRSFIARRGQFTRTTTPPSQVIGTIGEPGSLKTIRPDWNEAHIIAKGPALYHLLNGQLMAAAIDEAKGRRRNGELGMQVHVGPPMKVEYRNIRLKLL